MPIAAGTRFFRSLLMGGMFLLLLPLCAFAGTALGDFRSDVEHYRETVAALREGVRPAVPDLPGEFLAFAQKEAEYLAAFANRVPPPPRELERRIEAFHRARQQRLERAEESNEAGHPLLRSEAEAWARRIGPYLSEDYLHRLVVERALLQRREHDYDYPPSANFLERPLNRSLDALDYRREQRWYRRSGISKMETTFGFEPVMLLERENTFGLMAAAGMLYNFLPEMTQDPDNRYLPMPLYSGAVDRFVTEHLRKSGLRLGGGILFDNPSAVFGVGLQLRAITLWGVYSTGESDFSVALGVSNFEWLKKLNLVSPFGG